MEMSERMKKAVEAGSVAGLVPVLSHWPESELRALLEDIERFWDEAAEAVENAYGQDVLRPENFLSEQRAKALRRKRDSIQLELLATCSEIASVAMWLLPEGSAA